MSIGKIAVELYPMSGYAPTDWRFYKTDYGKAVISCKLL